MSDLEKRAFKGLFGFIISMAAMIFIPAWTFNYWQAWVFLTVFSASVLAITLYLMKHDTKLLESRMSVGVAAEKEQSQKIIQAFASVSFISLFMISALDYRFSWSVLPMFAVVVGDIMVALGLLIVFFVFKVNSFTSAIVEISKDQKIITSGPYAVVRHPMYIGALIMVFGIPLSLGSWWGLLAWAAMGSTIIVRLLDEEKFLTKNLHGYIAYQKKVKYRLIPFIW